MRNCTLPSVKTGDSEISLSDLEKRSEGWLLSCEIAQHSEPTLANRRIYVINLLWFLRQRKYESCSVMELRAFFAYCANGHKDEGGRWNNPQETKPVKSSTVAAYHRHIRALFNWIVDEDMRMSSPMARIPALVDRPDQVEPFTKPQLDALFAAAKKVVIHAGTTRFSCFCSTQAHALPNCALFDFPMWIYPLAAPRSAREKAGSRALSRSAKRRQNRSGSTSKTKAAKTTSPFFSLNVEMQCNVTVCKNSFSGWDKRQKFTRRGAALTRSDTRSPSRSCGTEAINSPSCNNAFASPHRSAGSDRRSFLMGERDG